MKRSPLLTSIVYLLLFLLSNHLASACSQKDEPLIEPKFEIAEQDMKQGFLKSAATTLVIVNTTLTANEWSVSSTASWCKATQSTTNNMEIGVNISVDANTEKKARETKVILHSSIKEYILYIRQQGTEASIDDIQLSNDIKIKPTLAEASDYQQGYEISKTYDGIIGENEKFYHSKFGKPASFPVTLEYIFPGDKNIDYLIYYTRGGNGNFGEVDIYTATKQEPRYKLYGSFDFRKQNTPSYVEFFGGLKDVYKIKFMVKSGLGDFASCDEMEFYERQPQQELNSLLTVFTDITCSELKPEVTDKQIALLPSYFADIALKLKNNSYNEWEKDFRIRNYNAYSIPEEWSSKLMTKNYSNLDNPTGIAVKKGEEVVLLVGDTHGNSISAQCIWEERSSEGVQTAASGDSYFLKSGINKLTMKGEGQLFIMYNTNITTPNAKPIKIHIPPGSGTVTGFFDLKEHKTDTKYAELLSKATHKYFCVRGNKIMFYFHRSKMTPQILSAINLWDDIIGWQQELMGIEDIRPSQVNNHIFAISPEYSYMWASDYRVAFVYTYLNNILLKDNVMSAKDNAWGPAHEIGHINQKSINWPSCTESSNNLFSNYILYKLGKYGSRGRALKALADTRFASGIEKRAWFQMGTSTHMEEDTELHMRMNWQLWNYYHRCGYKPDFWPTLFKLLREDRIVESNPGAAQLHFAKMACKAANQNLMDFFEMWGFFEPVDNIAYSQYGNWNYNVTPEMINQAKNYMKQFPTPKHVFYYLEDRKAGDEGLNIPAPETGYYTQFKENMQITKNPSASISGTTITITNGEQAVAFELWKGNESQGELLYFANTFQFTVPASININGTSLYAVQADGKRKLIKQIPS